MPKQACAGPGCASRRIHHERPDEPRGRQMVEVPEDHKGLAFCSITCALLAGVVVARPKPEEHRCGDCRRQLPDGHPNGVCPSRDDVGYF